MERLKNMGLKKSFLLLSILGIVCSLAIIGAVFTIGAWINAGYPHGGMLITGEGAVQELEIPTKEQLRVINLIRWIEILTCILAPVGCLGIASILFYRWKIREPVAILLKSTERIQAQDLAFHVSKVADDELGEVCAAFETMRAQLLQNNQELWRQAEERKRLNAAFSHDLRNPLTVLKGTIKQLRQGTADEQAYARMETYVLRLEQYVEAMSSIQRLEQIPVQKKKVELSTLRDEVEETARLLVSENGKDGGAKLHDSAGAARVSVSVECDGADGNKDDIELDHGLFLTVAENLIGNAARYTKNRICIILLIDAEKTEKGNRRLRMTVADDGMGYPAKLIKEGPKPFGETESDTAHFGMGLYISQVLCNRHGGRLILENGADGGAKATAIL